MRISRSTVAGLELVSTDGLTALIPPRDYSGLNQANTQLRVWLPEPAKLALEQACEIHDTSMTAYLTEYFAEYLYGHHELLCMKATRTGLYEPKPNVRYSAMTPVGARAEPDGNYLIEQAYLCVSLGDPWEGFCYKLIAAVLFEERFA